MKSDQDKIIYFIYARKSSESEDRQVQSIDDQIDRLQKMAGDLGLSVKEVLIETKSAKQPNNRPIFMDMMERIEKGEAQGILCWQINRLSRNPVDSGRISWMLQQGTIGGIRTIDRKYLPADNVLLFNIESGMANQYILDLSRDTKRGLLKKLNAGWHNGIAPLGYLNDKENKTIIKDPERYNLVRKMWDLMLTGNYTPPRILEIANDEWGFRTRKMKRLGDKPLSRSSIYNVFTSLFYAGTLEHKPSGNQFKGEHEPMITLEEYDRVQMLLGRKGKPRPKTHDFAFTGAIRCGVCGCFYTAETKKKLIKSTGEVKEYTYYHCTRRSQKVKCDQRTNIPVADLELAIEKEIEKYTILPEFLKWALEGIRNDNDTEVEDRSKTYEMQHKTLVSTQNELDELTKMRYRQLIDDPTFIKEKTTLQNHITKIKGNLRETENRAEQWLELTEKTFAFATYAVKAFITAKGKKGLELKKEILMGLGMTPIMQGGELTIQPNEWFVPVNNGYPALAEKVKGLELDKTLSDTAKTEALTSIRASWLPRLDSNQQPFA